MTVPIVSICSRSYDPLGRVEVRGAVVYNPDVSRRVTRTATLDGGCAIYDGGSTVADTTLKIAVSNPGMDLADAARRLFELWPRVSVALPSGCYEAAPESAQMSGGTLTLSLLLIGSL